MNLLLCVCCLIVVWSLCAMLWISIDILTNKLLKYIKNKRNAKVS
jgi:uncharacterized membrane protein YciS (DUF1049 family)